MLSDTAEKTADAVKPQHPGVRDGRRADSKREQAKLWDCSDWFYFPSSHPAPRQPPHPQAPTPRRPRSPPPGGRRGGGRGGGGRTSGGPGRQAGATPTHTDTADPSSLLGRVCGGGRIKTPHWVVSSLSLIPNGCCEIPITPPHTRHHPRTPQPLPRRRGEAKEKLIIFRLWVELCTGTPSGECPTLLPVGSTDLTPSGECPTSTPNVDFSLIVDAVRVCADS